MVCNTSIHRFKSGLRLFNKPEEFSSGFFQIYAPVRIGDTITATATVKEIIPERNRVVMETVCRNQDDVVVTTGEAVLLPPKESVDK